jgi:hypothetical protein
MFGMQVLSFDLQDSNCKSWRERMDALKRWDRNAGVIIMSYDAFKRCVTDDDTKRTLSNKQKNEKATKKPKKKSKQEREHARYLEDLRKVLCNSKCALHMGFFKRIYRAGRCILRRGSHTQIGRFRSVQVCTIG